MSKLNQKITFTKFADELDKVTSLMTASEAAGFLRGIVDASEMIMPSEYLPRIVGQDPAFMDFNEKEVNHFFTVVFSVQNMFSTAASKHSAFEFRRKVIHFDYDSLKSICNDLRSEIKGYQTALQMGNTDPQDFASINDAGKVAQIAYENLYSLDRDLESIINFENDYDRLPDESELNDLRMKIEDIKTILDDAYRLISEASRKFRADALKEQKLVADVARVGHARVEIKVSRNDPCPCGSGKKFKHCCFNRQN